MEGSNHSGGGSADNKSASQPSRPTAGTPDAGNMAEASSSNAPTPLSSRQSAPRTASSATAPPMTTAMQPPTLRKQLSGSLSNAGSSSASPAGPSRNTSPVRKDGSRIQPLSQPLATQPSAAAIQRALSAAAVPLLQSTTATAGESPSRVSRRGAPASGETTPQWPVSPRLKSPPPSAANSNARRSSGNIASKKTESNGSNAPSINVQTANPTAAVASNASPAKTPGNEDPQKTLQPATPAKGPSRGPSGVSTLETVQENTMDEIKEPSAATIKAATDLKPLTKATDEEPKTSLKREAESQHVDSGSESAGKAEKKQDRPTTPAQNSIQRPKSITKLSSVKSRQSDGKQGMTVETETVPSIPQSAINTGDRSSARIDNNGSVRLKTSNETIRPKKERKKALQKLRNQSSASSKADIFEARVASAVDEANSSESDETFVYESNPPDPQRRNTRHHSRTPSVASSHSAADQNRAGLRAFTDAHDERRIAGKRSMKFSNNLYNDLDSRESKDGSVRSHQPRHFGRFGRGGRNTSMFDPDSPYTQASKLRPSQLNNSQRRSRPNSPRSAPQPQQTPPPRPPAFTGRKQESSYDMMDVEGADDERTPLMGSTRTSRSARTVRRGGSGSGDTNNNADSIDPYYNVRRRSRCGRWGGCLLGFCIFALVVLSAVGFLVTSNRPLYSVQIHEIQNILASEQELFLDLCVRAVNPNSLGIAISEIELDVFAKSKYVGSNRFWMDHGFLDPDPEAAAVAGPLGFIADNAAPGTTSPLLTSPAEQRDLSPTKNHDHGTDDDDDDDLERDAQVMLLGRIYHFDQSLSFDGTPLSRRLAFSVGTLRLDKPGNKTETGGSARWEQVLKHPFDLIVRGTLRYVLPVSGRGISASVQGVVRFDPDEQGKGEGSHEGEDLGDVGERQGDWEKWLGVEFEA